MWRYELTQAVLESRERDDAQAPKECWDGAFGCTHCRCQEPQVGPPPTEPASKADERPERAPLDPATCPHGLACVRARWVVRGPNAP